ncbi:glycosyltransferase [Pedobacter nutrimenti]|uniref:glycosyltransferase n=1 Tax=Pedobacter nutrimenti TaxID=1241337 RepID=UPI00292FC5FF|nr:glycosyltransferase [Pedobacter nutrimenti]
MKILQINSVLNIGSTGRIAEELGQISIEKGWNSYIAYGREFRGESKSKTFKIGNKLDFYAHLVTTRLFDRHGFGSKRTTKNLIRYIKGIGPDVVVLHNIHGYYLNIEILFDFLKEYNKPVFWILYDCWSFTGHCAYFDLVGCEKWQKDCFNCPCKNSYPKSLVCNSSKNFNDKRRIFNGIENLNLIVHSDWLRKSIGKSFLKNYPVSLIRNGVNLDNFKPKEDNKIRDKYNLGNKFVILGVASVWGERKGFKDFLLLSEILTDEIIIMDGLSKEQERLLPVNIISIGKAPNVIELASIYSTADVFFNPTYEDNFPTTNLESMACGTPVITYDTGGSPEAVDDMTGFVCEKRNINEVYSKIKTIKEVGKQNYAKNCVDRANKLFDYKERYAECVDFFEKVFKQN